MLSSGKELNNSLFDLKKLVELGGLNFGSLVAVDPDLLEKFLRHISLKVKRDQTTIKLVLMTALSAHTSEPLNLFLRGDSSIGKTYNVVQVLKYLPSDDVWLLGGLSPTALVHDRGLLVDKNGEMILPSDRPGDEATQGEKEAYRARIKDSSFLVCLSGT